VRPVKDDSPTPRPQGAKVSQGSKLFTVAGLVLALFGPGIIAWMSSSRSTLGDLNAGLIGNGALLALALVVVGIIQLGERQGLASIGITPPRPSTFVWTGVLVAANMFLFTPIMLYLLNRMGDIGFGPGLRAFRAMPLWYRVTVVIVVPSLEELFYRGYAIERLAAMMRSRAAAVVASSVVFALVHAPTWGVAVSVALLIPSIFAGAFYAWRRDLVAMVLSHVATDALGFFTWAP
jgi:membrane protease YdiL (CAAX protease family)